MATPSATGSLNLLIELHDALFGAGRAWLASTLKGLAIHTADEVGLHDGPDYQAGWGLLNTLRAAELAEDDFNSGARPHVKEVILTSGDYVEFPVISDGTEPLIATICWTDPPGTPAADAVDPPDLMLVNDLDLRIVRDTVTYRPWVLDPAERDAAASVGDNFRDNVEQVVVDSPSAGGYLVRVTHKGQHLVDDAGLPGTQSVSIIVSGNVPQPKPELRITDIVRTSTDQIMLVWPSVVGQTYQLQVTEDLEVPDWGDIGPPISATKTTVAVVSTPGGAARFYRVVEVELP